MKKLILAFAVLAFMGACLPFSPTINSTPVVDVAATSAANVMNAVAQTLTAQPTSTVLPPTNTSASTQAEAAVSSTSTAIPPTVGDSTATGVTATFDIATSTDLPATMLVPAGSATATLTPGVLTYGTLPPAVPFSHITLVNRAKRDAYISLQVVTDEGGPTVIEYPVIGHVKIKAPLGHYLYVAWVGGREMIGEFHLKKDQELTIVLYKDRIEIK